jgi:hypothetical protein
MSDSAEDEGSLFSTAFEVGLDGSYRRVATDAAGTSTRSRVGKGAEREEKEQLIRLAQASETNERKAGTFEAKVIDKNAALEEQRKQMEQVKLRLVEYEKQSDGKRPIVKETRTGHTNVALKEMQRQTVHIQKVLTELQGQPQQGNYKIRDSGESDVGSRGSNSESSAESDDNDEKERPLGTTKRKVRKESSRQPTEGRRHESRSARRI